MFHGTFIFYIYLVNIDLMVVLVFKTNIKFLTLNPQILPYPSLYSEVFNILVRNPTPSPLPGH